jgi:hypothetical protein
MLRVRRLYFYLVLYAGLGMMLVGLATVIRVLLEQALGVTSSGIGFLGGNAVFAGREWFREQTAVGIALTVVGLPVWLLHWRAVRGWVVGPDGTDEQSSALRRLYVYGALLTTAISAYMAGRDTLAELLRLPLSLESSAAQLAAVIRPLPSFITAGTLWLFHLRMAAEDRDAAGEVSASATLRRWYWYLMVAAGALPLAVALQALATVGWSLFATPGPLAEVNRVGLLRGMAENGATVLAALVVWLYFRRVTETATVAGSWHGENEGASVLRKVHLYGITVFMVVGTLAAASELLRFAIASALGVAVDEVGGQPARVALGQPLSGLVVYGAFWAYVWRAVRAEALTQSEEGRQAGVRRLYYYLVAVVAFFLVMLSTWGLLNMLVQAVFDVLPVAPDDAKQGLARMASTLLIALPVWLMHWSRSQAAARGDDGAAERRSLTRRIYLYAIVFGTLAGVVVSGAREVYELTLAALGRPAGQSLAGALMHPLADGLLFGAALIYHWWVVLRADVAATRHAASERAAVAVVAGLDAAAVEALQSFIRDSLGGARTKVYWTDAAHARAVVEEAQSETQNEAQMESHHPRSVYLR